MAPRESVALTEPMLPPAGHRTLEDLAIRLASGGAALAAHLPGAVRNAVGDLVRSMNCYYSNLIEGLNTRPRDSRNATDVASRGLAGCVPRPNVKTGVALAASLLTLVACANGSSPTGPTGTAALSHVVETPALLFRSAPGDQIEVDRQQAYHAWAQQALGITAARRITYNKYLSRAHMGEVIGVSNTNAWAEAAAYAIHTIWSYDNHESVHLYASAIGLPVSLLTEGLAVAFQTNPFANDFVPRWSGTPIHDLARTFRTDGRLVPLEQLLQTSQFRSQDLNVVYPEAGSFVRFLIDTYGLATFKALYGRVTSNDVAATVAATFSSVYGKSVGELEADWWAMLEPRSRLR